MNKLHLLLLLILLGCKRERNQSLESELLILPAAVRINDLSALPDGSIAAVGGQRLTSAWYFHSTTGGQTWTQSLIDNRSSAYCMHIQNDSVGWLGGDSLKLWTTTNFTDWTFHWLADQVPTHESDRPAVRAFASDSTSSIYFVGGDYYTKGVAYASADRGNTWQFRATDNAMQSIATTETEVTAWGYGQGLRYNDATWFDVSSPSENIVSAVPGHGHTQWAAAASGAIYRREAPAGNWQKEAQLSDPQTLWLSGSHNNTHSVFGGSAGELLLHHRATGQWQRYKLEHHEPIWCVEIIGQYIYCGSDDGQIFKAELP